MITDPVGIGGRKIMRRPIGTIGRDNGTRQKLSGVSPLDTTEHEGRRSASPYVNRARAKFLTHSLATGLTEYAKRSGSPLERAYRRSIYCGDVIEQADGKTRSHYCGARWCVVCSRVRTARAIDAYRPIVETWSDPHMVTLTVRNVGGDELARTFDDFGRVFDLCKRSILTTHRLPFVAIRKLECTFSVHRGDYHPHLHIIIEGREQAELLRSLWLQRFGARAESAGQDVQRCSVGAVTELAKYLTKLTVKMHKGNGRHAAPVWALDRIFTAMKGRKSLQCFGFRLDRVVAEGIEGDDLHVTAADAVVRADEEAPIYWRWEQAAADWIDHETGEVLSGYDPSDGFRAFVEGIGGDSGDGAGEVLNRPRDRITTKGLSVPYVTSDGRLMHHPGDRVADAREAL